MRLKQETSPFATFLMDLDKEKVSKVQDSRRNTLLHEFVKISCEGYCNCCDAMIERIFQFDGARCANTPNYARQLPAHLAVSRSFSQPALKVLLHTKDLNHKDGQGKSPLFRANSSETIRSLLVYDSVDLFSRNKKGQAVFSALIDDGKFYLSIEGLLPSKTLPLMQSFYQADKRLAWTADESERGLTPLHYAMNLVRIEPLSDVGASDIAAVVFLLKLPEVEQVLTAYRVKSGDSDWEWLRDFAYEKKLWNAVKIIDSFL
ncbi:Ankyrin repeat-containing domain superfamily [Fusarium oxysporum f. sp. vasinfectum]|nr:Ankyrin repeat-containing domain superfamily [Fusarium oxysporum f. sp. vasinfectum]